MPNTKNIATAADLRAFVGEVDDDQHEVSVSQLMNLADSLETAVKALEGCGQTVILKGKGFGCGEKMDDGTVYCEDCRDALDALKPE